MQETQEMQVQSLGLEDPLEEQMATHSVLLGKFHGQGSLAGISNFVHILIFLLMTKNFCTSIGKAL